MRKTTKIISAALATVAMTTQAFAAGVCSRAEETAGVKAEILQQQLMVAAYSCHLEGSYNAFVINYRPDLVAADGAAQSLFQRVNATKGADDYQTFKTQMANDFSMDYQNQDNFCDNAQDMFQTAAEHRGGSLSALMAALSFDGATPFDQCTRDTPRVADADDGMVEGGSSGAVSNRTAR
jgi:hypothetical protein